MTNYVVKGMSEEDALMGTYRTVAKVSKLLPSSHQGEVHRVYFLRGTDVGYSWASAPWSRIPTAREGFQKLYGELQSSFFLSKRPSARSSKTPRSAPSLRLQLRDDGCTLRWATLVRTIPQGQE